MRRFALLIVLAAGVSRAAEEKKPDAAKLDGTWRVVSIQVGDQKFGDEELKASPGVLTLKDGKFTLKIGDMTTTGTYKVDATKKPVQVDTLSADGPNKGKTIRAIVEVSGDKMKACYDLSGNGRPKEFSTKDNPGYALIEYQREKK